MQKFVCLLASLLLAIPVFADNINYGYNSQGQYVPISVGNQRINYGYNAQGNYVPTSVGNTQINYGYNSRGQYVPTSTTPVYNGSMYGNNYNPHRIKTW
ncbi:MAG: hypothetical protein NC408_04485 [Candidatus Gastranaerophilales bacterium]|nr:hypothetical protein [Candidatus Gastranaerophilales bacterium]MCM1072271.1 hypothetical protein [Bacteroides sp.]